MKTVTALLALFSVMAGAAAASEPIDVVVVTAKKPASLLSDMTEEILDETSAALKAGQPTIVAEKVRVELPTAAPQPERG
jgi:hypothetical protein